MSIDAVIRFREAVNADEGLKRQLRGMEKLSPKALSALAEEHGYSFTSEEAAAVARDVGTELTEFELEMVTGGTDVERGAPIATKAAAISAPIEIEEPDDDSSC